MSGERQDRLPAPFGAGIDRNRPLTFVFEGRLIHGFAGDSIASALLATGVDLVGRSFKYHRPRAVLGLGGGDTNLLVTVDGAPNVPAELTPARQGMVVRAQNFRGSLARDRWALTGRFRRFLPVGFYYWAFRRPSFLWPFWERVIRRRAGLGAVEYAAGLGAVENVAGLGAAGLARGQEEATHGVGSGDTPHGVGPDKTYLFADVAVVGGGPAGLAAALAVAESGADVLLLERDGQAGGRALWSAGGQGTATGDRAVLDDLTAQAAAHARIDLRTRTVVTGLYADGWLSAVQAAEGGDALLKIRAQRVVLATGGEPQLPVFRNNDLPGVMFAEAAQQLIRRYGVRPGRRAVVLTTCDAGYRVADELAEAGVAIAAVVDTRPSAQGNTPHPHLPHPHLRGHMVAEAFGTRRLTGLRLGPATAPLTGERVIDCDLLVLATAPAPAGALWCHAGGRLALDQAGGALALADRPPGVTAAGQMNGNATLAAALRDGATAGRGAADALRPADPASRGGTPLDGLISQVSEPAVRAPGPLPVVPHPRGLDFVDLDEDLTVHDLTDAVAQGFDHAQLLKRYSTLGMGPSQGRHALLPGMIVAARARGEDPSATLHTTLRPPAGGVRFDTLAGRRLHPERRTPMHAQHLAAGASMMPAGTWWRPAVYARDLSRAEIRTRARAEARHLRGGVGLIDVSTLGKIEVRGPDAAAFLERLYTFRYAKQPVGRARYLLMTDEAGYVIDDGVACRLGPAHFYVTTTTGGAEQVFRAMLFWNAQWRMDVDVANVTGAWAAVNLAGPASREVLAEVARGVDLDGIAFPYLGVRTGKVAGLSARLVRIGFVGEWGYEIHVPAGSGAYLWSALTAAGKRFDIRPVGVEAQRLLRLEKGHLIVGQDTDGLTHPHEAGLDWAVKATPDFVGARAVAIHTRRPATRALVGFSAPAATDLFPEENHLVIRNGDIVGRVTSSGLATQGDGVVGLAWVAPDQTAPGTEIQIRVDHGTLDATVAAMPAYDPDNLRQETPS